MRVEWSPAALADAEAAVDFIAQDRPQTAEAWLSDLLDRTESLRRFPEQGRTLPELNRPDIRELLYPPYRIIYRVESERVSVLLLRHTRQLLDAADLDSL